MYPLVGEMKNVPPDMSDMIGLDTAVSGYGSTSDRQGQVRELYYPLVGDVFPGPWAYAMLAVIPPLGTIPPHRDAPLPPGFKRYHVVLKTNENCWNMHDGDWQQMGRGKVYSMEPTAVHASVNWGGETRVHLVIDAQACTLEEER